MYQTLKCDDGHYIAYNQLIGKSPGVVFLGGFMSDMNGSKATFLESFCAEIGQSFIRFDYLGHGASKGHITEGTIGHWKNDVITVLDRLAEGPQILVGSSMGGWLMLLATLARPAQVHALIGIAAAPDFTKDLSKLSSQQQADLETKGICYFQSTAGENTYPLTREFLADAGQHYVLDSHLPIACPVHLLHGMRDDIVDWRQSVKLAKHLNNDNVILTLIKDGDHRLSREQDLERLQQVLKNYT